MKRTSIQSEQSLATTPNIPTRKALQAAGENDFFERLQSIWTTITQLEDMGIIQTEQDKFMYAYRFAEAELQRACLEQASLQSLITVGVA